MMTIAGRAVLPMAASAMLLSWLVFTRYADADVPLQYLVRPLLVVGIFSTTIGLTTAFLARRYAIGASILLAAFGIAPYTSAIVGLIAFAVIVSARVLGWRLRDLQRPALVVLTMLWAISAGRAVLATDLGGTEPATTDDTAAQATYLILIDGYPSVATMRELGVNLEPFVAALEVRGFDHYPDATTPHTRTIDVLRAMLGHELTAPPGFAVVNSPWVHVHLRGLDLGPNVINNFEIDLVAYTAAATLAPEFVRDRVADALRRQLDQSLAVLRTTDHRRVFAHILSPHAPFLFGPDGGPMPMPECWPGCQPFNGHIDQLGVSVEEWTYLMSNQLGALNGRLLDTIDDIIQRQPDANIVLFSDHGAHPTNDPEELHRSFLAARTPDDPQAFADDPRPEAILPLLR